MKNPLKSRHFLAWLITTGSLVALFIVANILALDTFRVAINNRFEGERAIVEEGENAHLYKQDFETKEEAFNNGNKVVEKICDEGMVLLKNENKALPLKPGAKISVFGKNSVDIVTGGSGSAKSDDESIVNKTIFESLEAAGFSYNNTLKEFYKNNGASGTGRTPDPSMDSGVSILETGETPISSYTSGITASYADYKDAAIVVFSRIAGETLDLPRHASDVFDNHYLELDNNEKALLEHICAQNFEHVIVLINSSNMIDPGFLELSTDPSYNNKIDAAILIGSPGGYGIMSLGRILSGEVTPSGHTIDTYYTKYQDDPTWQNFGDNLVEKGNAYLKDGNRLTHYFVDYEEGIYLGYRYYETAAQVLGEDWYKEHVIYPFGFGLSYTTFEETLLDKNSLESDKLNPNSSFDVKVKVKNTGDVKGQQVVQLYASAPYKSGGIEKAYKVLVGFAKTKVLKPDQEETLTIKVTPYDFASFDYNDANNNTFKGYELEKGNYTFFVGRNAHDDIDSFTKELVDDARFETDPETGTKIDTLFADMDDHLQTQMSRADFVGTFPVMPTDADRTVDDAFVAKLDNRDVNYKEDLSKMPTMGKEITIEFKYLNGLDYNDKKWDEFLDQMTFEEMLSLFNDSCYNTPALQRLGVPKTISFDGPTGIVNFMGSKEVYGTTYYCSECLVAQTYNLNLAVEQGTAIGNEALIGDARSNGSHLPYTGWYGPAVNLHRSPFSGRNTEYYSEDPFISGKFAAKVIEAVQEKGVYANIKHFAVNDQETCRDANGVNTWLNEQALRELYLKPFEIAIKEGKSKGVMSSFNRIGTVWTGGCYELITTVLREEWGFVGSVICDFHVQSYMNNRQMAYAGGDVNLTLNKQWTKASASDPGDVNVLRRAAHNTLYCVVNSNAVRANILGYLPAYWQIALYSVDATLGVLLLAWGIVATLDALGIIFKKKKGASANAE